MAGPERRGPTPPRRLITAAKSVVLACTVIVLIAGAWAWHFIDATSGTGGTSGRRGGAVLVTGERESVPPTPARTPPERRVGATIDEAMAAAAFVVVDLSTGRAIREQKGEWLDTPAWPGSIAKLATFAAAIDAGALTEATRITCTRHLTLPGGRGVDCTHPPLAHPMSPVEALANSCNVFTATIARGLTREQLSSGFVRLGLSPVPSGTDLMTGAFGLGGTQVTPRKLIEAVRRAAGIPLIREGLRASATTGTSSAFADAGIEALAKTGTAPMRGGRALGLVSAVTPADSPRLGIVVALPGGSGAQAAETAAAILRTVRAHAAAQERPISPSKESAGPGAAAVAVFAPSVSVVAQEGSARSGAPAAVVRMRIGQPTAKGYAVETLDVEEYVARVVAGETSDATPAAAREALAITARTFAMVNRGRHADDGFDLCTLTHCQVTRPATRSSRAAAERTRGQVLIDARGGQDDRDGRSSRLAPVFYSASCGGMLADARTVVPNADAASMPWLESRPDPAGIEEVTWTTEIPADDLLRALQQSGSRGDTLRNLIAHGGAGGGAGAAPTGGNANDDGRRVPKPSTPANLGRRRTTEQGAASESSAASNASSDRGSSIARGSSGRSGPGTGTVTHVTTEGLTPSTLSIDDFRRAVGQQLGWQFLKSPRFTVQRTSRGYRFTGRGHGHGVGLCVLGASALAARGDDAPRIVEAYFPGLQIAVAGSPGSPSLAPLSQPARPATTNGAAAAGASRPTPIAASGGARAAGAPAGRADAANAGADAGAAAGAGASRTRPIAASGGARAAGAPAGRAEGASAGADAGAAAVAGASRTTPIAASGGAREAGAPAGRAEGASAGANAGGAPAIQLRLPSRDEGERARLMRLIATNLKELALDLSLPSPSGLDVVVHPTVHAYRRATRSPSWTSAATILSGDDITLHFAPLSVLDRGAMLTQTIRHELVHVLTLRALFERPRWVHEGLALHFAGERVSAEPEETSGDDVKCPSDRDLMRPRSRDAFDRAYSRAAACVARDLAAGRSWRDLGAR